MEDYCEIETLDGKKVFFVNVDKEVLILFFILDEKKFMENEFSARDQEGNRIFIKGSEIVLRA